jgi:hypothetical protein
VNSLVRDSGFLVKLDLVHIRRRKLVCERLSWETTLDGAVLSEVGSEAESVVFLGRM